MKVICLQSGSNGNCIYVEAAGARLLFDAGISGRVAQGRLAERGRDIAQADALVISHDHRDHTCHLGVFQRRFGVPVYVTQETLSAARAKMRLGALGDIRFFQAAGTLRFDGVTVETVPTPHDGADGVAFVVDDGRRRLGILTDLGHVFPRLADLLPSLDAAVVESNFDPGMLAQGRYPELLKQRIRGPRGHLSNSESAQLLAAAAGPRLQWACLAHLSEENNGPEIALRTHRRILGTRLPLHVAGRHAATEILEVH